MIRRFPREKKLTGENCFWEVRFSKLKKTSSVKNPKSSKGVKKPFSRGGVDLNIRGVGHKKSKQQGVYSLHPQPLLTYG